MSPGGECVRRFDCFGARVEVRVAGRSAAAVTPQLAGALAQAKLLTLHARLSRFTPDSELSRCNADPRVTIDAGRLMRRLARAVVDAAERSGGLVDATLLDELERAGYGASRADVAGLPAGELQRHRRSARPAGPHPDRRWRRIVVDDAAGTITRPPGLRIDSGGLGKGLAADIVAAALADHPRFAVDCAGDVRIGGSDGAPRAVLVEDPFGAAPVCELRVARGAVATSGIARRSWRDRTGAAMHHLLDPATGRPAWTGVVQATALAPTALEAETLAKAALLAGPRRGRELLAHGGVLVLDDGAVKVVDGATALLAA